MKSQLSKPLLYSHTHVSLLSIQIPKYQLAKEVNAHPTVQSRNSQVLFLNRNLNTPKYAKKHIPNQIVSVLEPRELSIMYRVLPIRVQTLLVTYEA